MNEERINLDRRYTQREAAELLGVGLTTIEHLRKSGQLLGVQPPPARGNPEAKKTVRRWYFLGRVLKQYIDRTMIATPTAETSSSDAPPLEAHRRRRKIKPKFARPSLKELTYGA